MARDRRRAKQRRDRQARSGGGAQPRRVEGPAAPAPSTDPERTHEPADPPELTSGEIDVADAQLALGRPDLVDAGTPVPPAEQMDAAGTAEIRDEQEFEALEDRVEDADEAFFEEDDASIREADEGGAIATRSRRRAPARGAESREGGRLMTFLRGSWRELQRVQWPDRRQVGQATAVVIGFVIVAGAFLGLADYVAGKIVEVII